MHVKNRKIIFYGHKIKLRFGAKDKVLRKMHNEPENKNKLQIDKNDNIILHSCAPFAEENEL